MTGPAAARPGRSWDLVLPALEQHGWIARMRGHLGADVHCRLPGHSHDDAGASGTVDYRGDKVLYRCHARPEEHTYREVSDAIGISQADWFDNPPATRHLAVVRRPPDRKCGHTGKPRTIRHVYTDPGGDVQGVILREECPVCGKRISTTAERKWPVDQRCLYHWPEVAQAIEAGTVIYVTEGEKSADRLAGLGHVATSNPFGADDGNGSKWRPSMTKALAGARDVVIIADHDQKGWQHAAYVASQLRGAGIPVRVVRSATGQPKDDIVEHLQARYDVGDLVGIDPEQLLADATQELPIEAETPSEIEGALDALRKAAGIGDAEQRAREVHAAAAVLVSLDPGDDDIAVAKEILRPVKQITELNQQLRAAKAARRHAPADGFTRVNMAAAGFSFSVTEDGRWQLWREDDDPEQPPCFAGDVPILHALVIAGEGSAREVSYLLSKDPDSPRIPVPGEEIESGKYTFRLGMPRSADRRIKDAVATVILHHQAGAAGLPQLAAYPAGDARDETGHLFIPVPEVLPDGYCVQPPGATDADLAAADEGIAAVCEKNPKLALFRGFSVGSPFVAAEGRQPFWVNAFGFSRRGKTIALLVSAYVWGRVRPPLPAADSALISWDATGKGPGRYLGQLGILPACFDETGTAEFSPAEWARMCYGITQGASRLQATQLGGLSRRTPGHRGITFVSGNDMLCDGMAIGAFQGLPARLLQFAAPFTSSAAEAESLYPLLVRGYGWLGPAVLAAITPEEMAVLIAKAEADLGIAEEGVPRSIGQALAIGVAGAMAADQVTGTNTAGAALKAAAEYLVTNSGAPETDGQRMLSVLSNSLTYNPSAWASQTAAEAWLNPPPPSTGSFSGAADDVPRHGLDRELRGFYDQEWLYVAPWAWKEFAEQEGAGRTAAARELHEAGQLRVPDRVRSQNVWQGWAPRWAGRGRAYVIARSALPEPQQDDETEPEEEEGEDTGWQRDPGGDHDQEQDPGDDVADGFADHDEIPPDPRPMLPWGPGIPGNAYVHDVVDQAGAEELRSSAPVVPLRPVVTGAAPIIGDGQPTGSRDKWLADAIDRKVFRTNLQYETLERATAALDAGEPPERLRTLAALEGSHGQPGPFAPLRGKRQPYWAPELPAIAEAAFVADGWTFTRKGYTGEALSLDVNGAFVASFASAEFAHGELLRTGPVDDLPSSGLRPGYYLMTAYEWTEGGMPSPLNRKPGTQAWVPGPTAGLLRDLAAAGRWPDASASDSFTGNPCRLSDWAHFVAELRKYALERYGRGSDRYDVVKDAFGAAIGLMQGSWADGETVPRRVWKCRCRRRDWAHTVKSQAGVTQWRRADRCRLAAPDLPPLALRNIDELVLPAAALELVTADPPGGGRPPIRIDETGVLLGTLKIKARETWRP